MVRLDSLTKRRLDGSHCGRKRWFGEPDARRRIREMLRAGRTAS